ncbi:MAG: peptidoglycan-binding protein [Alphaproteobacteria bacterium]|nr:peptidoglycan-binding protein [Alphaproteobacteria bacterium]
MKIRAILSLTGAVFVLSGCMQLQLSGIFDTSASESDIDPVGPVNAEPGFCYGKEISPAIFETVTEQTPESAAVYATDGNLIKPAIYRTETVNRTVRDRADIWFKVPCNNQKVGAYVASLQRALKVRGLYKGSISGEMSQATRKAVRRFQRPQGFDSGKLSLVAARKLGLVAVPREGG